jgi:hypothetical protein
VSIQTPTVRRLAMKQISAAIGGLCVCAFALFAAYFGKETKFSTRAERRADDLRRNIEAEIKNLGVHRWAGEYYEGDGLGVGISLVLAPKAGYVFEWHGCMGVYDRNYGGLSVANDRIRLSFTFANKTQGFQGISPEFLPVSWGPRTYLIPPNDIIEFCNSVNAGDEPRNRVYGRHLLRRGDETKPVDGFPTLPAEFERYLQKKPITVEIVATGVPKTRPSLADWKFKDTPVTVKGGTDVGLRRGMELHVTSPEDTVQSVQIEEVEEHSSEGVMTEIGEGSPGPRVGWKLSTRPRWASHNRNEDTAKDPTGR